MSKKVDKVFRAYTKTIREIAFRISLNMINNGAGAPDTNELIDRVSYMVNDFVKKFMAYSGEEMTSEEMDIVDNRLREHLLKFGNYYDEFVADEDIILFCGRKITKLMILTTNTL